ncbi:MAG: carbonic anhydrase [Vicinamibacterales bacterium]
MQTRSFRTQGLTRVSLSAVALVAATSLVSTAPASEGADPLVRLRAGNERFVKGANAEVPLGQGARQPLTQGQHPFAMVLSCADSRVPPEYIFNAGLGELFVIRSAGEVMDHSVAASLEYGAEHLHIPLLVVMGHESCGAVTAASQAEHGEGPNLDYLVTHIRAGIQRTPEEQHDLRTLILANVEQVINDALTGSSILRGASAAGHLKVVGAYYELATGRVIFSEPVGATTTVAAHK